MKQLEFSQKITLSLMLFGIAGITCSYILAFMGRDLNQAVTLALITEVVAVSMSYLIYQFKLKDSRNRHQIDKDGMPFSFYEDEEVVKNTEN